MICLSLCFLHNSSWEGGRWKPINVQSHLLFYFLVSWLQTRKWGKGKQCTVTREELRAEELHASFSSTGFGKNKSLREARESKKPRGSSSVGPGEPGRAHRKLSAGCRQTGSSCRCWHPVVRRPEDDVPAHTWPAQRITVSDMVLCTGSIASAICHGGPNRVIGLLETTCLERAFMKHWYSLFSTFWNALKLSHNLQLNTSFANTEEQG